jgi:endonuclease/exonuclease/phosphatase family metal-dependent hydrolase
MLWFAIQLLICRSVYGQTADIPARTQDNIIVASYNIQWLGQSTHDYQKLAEVIQHFDVCGILEVRKESAIAELTAALETKTQTDWGYVFGIRTHNPSGNYHESYGAVWRKDRVELGDGIVSIIWDKKEAFRNDPFMVSFKRDNFDFTLMLNHTRWTNDDDGTREGEVAMLAEQILWMKDFLPEQDFILAGDFNYAGDAEPMKSMAEFANLTQLDPPDQKSTFKKDYSGYASSYDHMYISADDTPEYIPNSCKILDATMIVFGDDSKANMKLSKKELSDHLPIYAVFKVSQADDD